MKQPRNDITLIAGNNELNIQMAPPGEAKFEYASDVRYFDNFNIPPLPGSNPEYACNPRWDYQCFEVDVLNVGSTVGECVLECYIHKRPWVYGAPWSDWTPDYNFECSLWCGEPWRCCFNAEPYRIKRAVIQPGQVATFRGLCWIHGIGEDNDLQIQAKFIGPPGEILTGIIGVPAYA